MVVVPDRFPMLCYPALELQDRMRRMTLGALGTVLWLLPIALRVKLTKQPTWCWTGVATWKAIRERIRKDQVLRAYRADHGGMDPPTWRTKAAERMEGVVGALHGAVYRARVAVLTCAACRRRHGGVVAPESADDDDDAAAFAAFMAAKAAREQGTGAETKSAAEAGFVAPNAGGRYALPQSMIEDAWRKAGMVDAPSSIADPLAETRKRHVEEAGNEPAAAAQQAGASRRPLPRPFSERNLAPVPELFLTSATSKSFVQRLVKSQLDEERKNGGVGAGAGAGTGAGAGAGADGGGGRLARVAEDRRDGVQGMPQRTGGQQSEAPRRQRRTVGSRHAAT